MIKPWLFEFFPELTDASGSADPKAVTRYFQTYLDIWARDEALGFEGIFFSEHHFGNAYSPSPNLLIAAMAGRTRTMRLGVMGVVAPYYTPWRIFEEIAMLDHLTDGRLEIGTAVGIPPELAYVGMTMQEARERNDEAIEILDALLAREVVSFNGKYTKIENLRPLPRPRQQPSPPVWTTVVSDDSARKAARRGSKISTAFNPTERIKEIFDAYRDEADKVGFKAGPEHLGLRRRIAIAETESEAKEYMAAVEERLRATLAKDPRAAAKHIPDSPDRDKIIKGKSFEVSDEEFLHGTPAQIAEKIIDQCRRTGAGHFLAILHWGAPVDEVIRGHELFGREVIPILRKASVA
jgi:alkanesulfonate monooxygenase SsuD/methylene tetrahydromethanopterin reductase-like flavin-dependent oxidoreductase (luciferase family)